MKKVEISKWKRVLGGRRNGPFHNHPEGAWCEGGSDICPPGTSPGGGSACNPCTCDNVNGGVMTTCYYNGVITSQTFGSFCGCH